MCISLLLLIPSVSKIDQMINLLSFATWTFFFLCFLSQIYLRFKKPELRRPFKVMYNYALFYPVLYMQVWIIVPVIMCCSAIVLIILPIFEDAIGFLIALSVILTGLPVYFVLVSQRNKLPQKMFTWFGTCCLMLSLN